MSPNHEPQQARRRFLKTTTGLAVAMALPTQALAADDLLHLERHGHQNDDRFWHKVKKEFVLARRTTYMNIGTTGSMPRRVLEGFDTNNEIVARDPWAMEGKFGGFAHVGDMIKAIAPGFGADEHEIVLSRNTTDGICTIIGGLQFEPGDVILTTHHEHVGLTSPLTVASQRFGVEVVELEIPVDTGANSVTEEDFIRVFADAVAVYGSRVRLLAFSHITYKTGTVLPAKRICKEVAVPNRIPTLVDGAHGIGMMDLNFHDMDCDFYAGPGHKWQCGPGATGILYVRDEAKRLKEFWGVEEPLYLINSSLAPAQMGICQRMQYIGNDHFPAKQALTDSCLMWDTIGRDRIEQRVRELGSRCKRKLAKAFPHAKIYSPDVEGLNCGLTSVNPFDDQTDGELLLAMRDRLREEYGYIIRTTDFRLYKDDVIPTQALRISTHLFHDESDVDGLVAAMRKVYRELA